MQISDLTEEQLLELNKRFDAVRDPNNPYGVLPDTVTLEIKERYFLELEEAAAKALAATQAPVSAKTKGGE